MDVEDIDLLHNVEEFGIEFLPVVVLQCSQQSLDVHIVLNENLAHIGC